MGIKWTFPSAISSNIPHSLKIDTKFYLIIHLEFAIMIYYSSKAQLDDYKKLAMILPLIQIECTSIEYYFGQKFTSIIK